MASIEVDAGALHAVIVPVHGQRLSVAELNAALGRTPYRVTGLRDKA